MTEENTIQKAIRLAAEQQATAQAQLESSAPAESTSTAVSMQSATGTAVAVPAAKLTMETVMTGQMSVDAWLKPTENGLKLGDAPDLFQDLPVVIDMTDGRGFIVKQGIKGGNPAQYAYTTDGATAVSGGSWEAACDKIRKLDPSKPASPYRCVDLPMYVPLDFSIDTIVDKKVVPKKIVDAGKTLGYTTSTTNWKAWELFYRECESKGLLGKKVLVHVGAEERKNKAGNIWGTMTFKLIGEADVELASE